MVTQHLKEKFIFQRWGCLFLQASWGTTALGEVSLILSTLQVIFRLAQKFFPFATITTFEETAHFHSFSSELWRGARRSRVPDICTWLCKYKVFRVNVAVCDWWRVLNCTQVLELKQEVFVTAHLAKHWQDPCRPSVCDSRSSPCCKWRSASSIVFSFLPWCCIWEHALS